MAEQLYEIVKRTYNSDDIHFYVYPVGSCKCSMAQLAEGESEESALAALKIYISRQVKTEEVVKTFKIEDLK